MNPVLPPAPPPPGASFFPPHPPNPSPPASSLSVALSELKFIIDQAETSLHSLPTPIATTTSGTFVPCPFYPNHRVPPSSLFSHYLNCPSPLSLPHTFHYPLTLCSSASSSNPLTLPADSSDLTISLDNYVGFIAPTNSFFYQNCPGPVNLIPSVQPPPTLKLPWILSIECADFDEDSSMKGLLGFPVDFIKFLPSEIWAIRSETEAWNGTLPACYSWRILRAVTKSRDCNLLHLREWILANSPRYGVIIDSPLRDHVFVLVKLCLKVVVREAFELVGVKRSDGELSKAFSGLTNRSFECPVLVKVMMWLALQFSILYGEVNAKFLVVDVLKEYISNTAMRASFFSLEGEDAEMNDGGEVDGGVEELVPSIASTDDAKRDERENIEIETIGNSLIFVSGVAAAVAALHERSLIEEKIKALRNSQPLSAYHRNLEHARLSSFAAEERKRRPEYKPIIEHDGFLRHRSNNQEANKVKTREELLAEERDYKRRRMSYRGKKVKRNPLEVSRDIIEEYMEEIRQAGGVGGILKDAEEREALGSENLDTVVIDPHVSGSRRNSVTPEKNRGLYVDDRNGLHSSHCSRDTKDVYQWSEEGSTRDRWRQYPSRNVKGVRYDRDDHYPNRNVKGVGYDRDDHFGSQDGRQISSYNRKQGHGTEEKDFVVADDESFSYSSHRRQNEAHDEKYYKRNRDEHERRSHKRGRDEPERTSRKRERDDDSREHWNRGRSKTDSASRKRDDDKGRRVDKRKSETGRNRSSSRELHEFEDRYDPLDSHY